MAKVKQKEESYDNLFKDMMESQKEIEELSKKVAEEKPVVELPKGVVPVVKQTNYAYGVCKNKETSKWEVLEIVYDTETSEAKINNTVYSSTSRNSAQVNAEEFLARRLNNLSIPKKYNQGT